MKTIILDGKEYQINESGDEPMMQQLVAQGAEIIAACNGAGICQTCAFKPIEGEFTEKSDTEKMMDLPEPERLSCQCLPKTDGEIQMSY
ncbi:(2Fe-2S)-binding protein [Candidatus Peregrinibacteria bacterium]|nr:MAG: (2Fe-2S)-binding protein [Candidatus Peregrinibacteria bacterium]